MTTTKTTVVNMRNESCDFRIDRQSIFGNPFILSSSMSRDESIARYQVYFDKRIAEDEDFVDRVKALAGFKLGCWCKPKACHGDIIVAWLNENE